MNSFVKKLDFKNQSAMIYPLLYLLFYCISGCNYKVFQSCLMSNPLLFIGLYNLVSVVATYLPLYSYVEKNIFPAPVEKNDSRRLNLSDCREAIQYYGWGLLLSIASSIGWQMITYGFLIHLGGEQGALLALLITALSRLVTPILSLHLFEDKIENYFFYWVGLIISILGVFWYQFSSKTVDYNTITPIYYIASFMNLLMITANTIVKRYITSDPKTDSIPSVKQFLGIQYQPDYHISVRLKGFLNDISVAIILITIGFNSNQAITMTQIAAILWIGIIGSIAYTLSMRISNYVSNTVTVVLDGFRPIVSYFIFPIITMIFIGGEYALPLHNHFNHFLGLLLCFMGSVLSLQFGRPQKSNSFK